MILNYASSIRFIFIISQTIIKPSKPAEQTVERFILTPEYEEMLELWDEQMVSYGQKIIRDRGEFLKKY